MIGARHAASDSMERLLRQQQSKQIDITGCLKCTSCVSYVEHCNWRGICQNCRCPCEAHRESEMPAIINKLSSDLQRQCGSASDNDSGCALEEYAWVPPGVRIEQVYQYFNYLPEDKIPFIGSVGEQYRLKQLVWQLPPHDSDIKFCRQLSSEERREHINFNNQRKREALGRGTVRQLPLTLKTSDCTKCTEVIKPGEIATFAARAKPNSQWHPQCFTCDVCEELLVDLIYFYREERIYCGRHYGEKMKPRCAACDEIIFADECTEAEDRYWHINHFGCFDCNMKLGDDRYVMRDGMPYCCDCFELRFSEFCVTCGGPIGVDQGQMTHGAQHWHANEKCFHCATCNRPLLGHPFLPKNSVTYCSVECSRGITVHGNNHVETTTDSIPSACSNSTELSPNTHQFQIFEDPWVRRNSETQLNHIDQSLTVTEQHQRSLPDLATDGDTSPPPLPPKNRATSDHKLKFVDRLPPSAQNMPINAKQKCVKWAAEQKSWPISPIQLVEPAAQDLPKKSRMQKSSATSNLHFQSLSSQQRALLIAQESTEDEWEDPRLPSSHHRRQSEAVLLAGRDAGRDVPSISKMGTRKHRTKRLSRSQRERLSMRRTVVQLPDGADNECSTCSGSSSEESDLDDTYQAEVMRNRGLRTAFTDKNTIIAPTKPICRAKKATKHKKDNCSIQ